MQKDVFVISVHHDEIEDKDWRLPDAPGSSNKVHCYHIINRHGTRDVSWNLPSANAVPYAVPCHTHPDLPLSKSLIPLHTADI